jgi:putative MATE family efflux protein
VLDTSSDFTKGPIAQHLKEVALPTSIGFLFYTFFNVVDTFFAGQLSSQAIAGITFSFPLYFTLIALSVGLSTGTTVVISNAIGMRDLKNARIVASQALTFSFVISACIAFLGVRYAESIFVLMGAEDSYLDEAVMYVNVLFYGALPFVLVNALNGILVAQGKTKPYRNCLIASFFLNIFLDPWLLYGGLGIPPLGVSGIALATVITQCVSAAYLARVVYAGGLLSFSEKKMFVPKLSPLLQLAYNGIPSSLNMMTIALGVFVTNYYVAHFGERVIAGLGVGVRIEQIALLPIIGLSSATLTIVGQNNGAGLFERAYEVWKVALRLGLYASLIGMALLLIFSSVAVGLFSDDPQVVFEGVRYLRISSLALFAYSALFISVSALQGIKRPIFIIFLGVSRQVIAPVIIFGILLHFYPQQVSVIWWATISIVWSAALVCMLYARAALKKKLVER